MSDEKSEGKPSVVVNIYANGKEKHEPTERKPKRRRWRFLLIVTVSFALLCALSMLYYAATGDTVLLDWVAALFSNLQAILTAMVAIMK